LKGEALFPQSEWAHIKAQHFHPKQSLGCICLRAFCNIYHSSVIHFRLLSSRKWD